jgi:hypothetical protein
MYDGPSGHSANPIITSQFSQIITDFAPILRDLGAACAIAQITT